MASYGNNGDRSRDDGLPDFSGPLRKLRKRLLPVSLLLALLLAGYTSYYQIQPKTFGEDLLK